MKVIEMHHSHTQIRGINLFLSHAYKSAIKMKYAHTETSDYEECFTH